MPKEGAESNRPSASEDSPSSTALYCLHFPEVGRTMSLRLGLHSCFCDFQRAGAHVWGVLRNDGQILAGMNALPTLHFCAVVWHALRYSN